MFAGITGWPCAGRVVHGGERGDEQSRYMLLFRLETSTR